MLEIFGKIRFVKLIKMEVEPLEATSIMALPLLREKEANDLHVDHHDLHHHDRGHALLSHQALHPDHGQEAALLGQDPDQARAHNMNQSLVDSYKSQFICIIRNNLFLIFSPFQKSK